MTLARQISDNNLARTVAETNVKLNKVVTVASVGGSNKYFIDGTQQATISLARGSTYVFNVSNASVSGHPLQFSTTSNGTHNSGSAYTTGVTVSGTAGQANATVTIVVAADAPDILYYYCSSHSGMGGTANIVDQHVLGFDGTSFVPVAAKRQLKSTRSANVEGGATGSIPYNTGASTTTFLGIGSTNQILVVAGGVPAWATSDKATQADLNSLTTTVGTKSPIASPTFTGTVAGPTINASTSLQIGGVAISASAAELNYNDVTTLGTTQASKTVTADANGVVTFDNGKIEESTAITSSSNAAALNLRLGDNFTHTLSENVTYTFSNPAANGKVSAFTLKVTQDSSARVITWPNSVDWGAGTAPTLSTGNAAVDVFVFVTYDGGTIYYGFTAGQAMA